MKSTNGVEEWKKARIPLSTPIKKIDTEWRRTELPENMKEIKSPVDDFLQERVRKL